MLETYHFKMCSCYACAHIASSSPLVKIPLFYKEGSQISRAPCSLTFQTSLKFLSVPLLGAAAAAAALSNTDLYSCTFHPL